MGKQPRKRIRHLGTGQRRARAGAGAAMLEPGKACCGCAVVAAGAREAPVGVPVQPRLRNEWLLLQNCLGSKSCEQSSRVIHAKSSSSAGGAAPQPCLGALSALYVICKRRERKSLRCELRVLLVGAVRWFYTRTRDTRGRSRGLSRPKKAQQQRRPFLRSVPGAQRSLYTDTDQGERDRPQALFI